MSRKPAPYHPYSREGPRNSSKDFGRSFHGPMREHGKKILFVLKKKKTSSKMNSN